MADGPYPSLGLYWFDAADPTVLPGLPAPINQLLVRTDVAELYYKSGAADTAWTRIGNGGPAGIAIDDEGAPIGAGPFTEIDFVGAGVSAADVGGGVGRVTIPGGISGVAVQDEGGAVVTTSTLNFVGGGIQATNVAGVGTITVPAPPTVIFALPEKWGQNGVTASQTNVPLTALVSVNFDDLKMIRAGSIVGIRTRLTDAVTAGSLAIKVTKNGVAGTLAVTSTSISNQTGGVATEAAGVDTYIAGDAIGVMITLTSGDFAPSGGTNLEVWLEVSE
jgi:hypothetical protein